MESDKIRYPLEQVALIKARRLEESEKVLKAKKEALVKEEEKLDLLEKEKEKVKHHKQLKLEQLRNELDSESTTLKIQQMKQYLKVVDEQLKQKEAKVKEQQKKVDAAAVAVEEARKDMFQKQHDVEKIQIHRQEWEKEKKDYLEHLDAIETDELGTTSHIRHKKEKNR